MYSFARAAIRKHCELGNWNHRNLLPHSSGSPASRCWPGLAPSRACILGSYCQDKTPWLKWGGKVLFHVIAYKLIPEGSQGRNLEVGTEQRPWFRAAYCLAPDELLSLSYRTQHHLCRDGNTTINWTIPRQSLIKEMCHRPVWERHFLNWGFFISNDSKLCWVDKNHTPGQGVREELLHAPCLASSALLMATDFYYHVDAFLCSLLSSSLGARFFLTSPFIRMPLHWIRPIPKTL